MPGDQLRSFRRQNLTAVTVRRYRSVFQNTWDAQNTHYFHYFSEVTFKTLALKVMTVYENIDLNVMIMKIYATRFEKNKTKYLLWLFQLCTSSK